MDDLFQHELGDYLQSLKNGWVYLSKFEIPSLTSSDKWPGQGNNFIGFGRIVCVAILGKLTLFYLGDFHVQHNLLQVFL